VIGDVAHDHGSIPSVHVEGEVDAEAGVAVKDADRASGQRITDSPLVWTAVSLRRRVLVISSGGAGQRQLMTKPPRT
jgi:hypothetical protein